MLLVVVIYPNLHITLGNGPNIKILYIPKLINKQRGLTDGLLLGFITRINQLTVAKNERSVTGQDVQLLWPVFSHVSLLGWVGFVPLCYHFPWNHGVVDYLALQLQVLYCVVLEPFTSNDIFFSNFRSTSDAHNTLILDKIDFFKLNVPDFNLRFGLDTNIFLSNHVPWNLKGQENLLY